MDSKAPATQTSFAILIALGLCHMLNDTNQSLLLALYPVLKENYALNFTQIGMITLAFQITASLLQPAIGLFTDRRPLYRSLPLGMGFTFVGLLLLARADSYPLLLVAAMLIGTGSAVFHPESSRVARLASGGRYGLAQSIFQVGGNLGQALGPLLAAIVLIGRGQAGVAWFSLVALTASLVLWRVSGWYRRHGAPAGGVRAAPPPIEKRRTIIALSVLLALMLSKNIYTVSLSSYYTFYLIETFHLEVFTAQICLFIFLGAVAVSTFFGGPLGDRMGRKYVIWFSILGALPFTLALPYAGLAATIILTVVIGLIIGASFSSIVVYGQELLPGRVGMVAGLFFGLSFGIGGLGAALLGVLADHTSIGFAYQLCSYLPLLGLLAWFLPDMNVKAETAKIQIPPPVSTPS